ncbi:SMI1/KNR4 family protein [Vibrio metoecus]|uniref:hypothetical protein n=1 Tax=Vibrio metoecus TaxID=1481663 RepID=UPI000BA927F2|nr:hypothetical protein [Vibrio metoecus]PAR29445.1 hypothetical protein CGU00_02695 [Vibrio metoecus]PAR42165.1 hypothetical protein CGT95_18445 [Vibrio metoecus]
MNIEKFKIKVATELPDSNLTTSTENELKKLKSLFAGLPDEYLSFLKNIGYGSFDGCAFSIYGGPLEPDEIFEPETASELTNYIFIGDDFSGWMLAYDMSQEPYKLTLFDHNERSELSEIERSSLVNFLNFELFER